MKMNFDDLIERGLVKRKSYENGLSVYKYSRKVFYDNLWNLDSRLLEARGIVLDSEGKVVIWPFTKVFNYGENNTFCDPDREIIAVRKVNGFMAAARYYNNELLISTTGTLDSEYAEMARKHIENLNGAAVLASTSTLIFEICDANDPHIVEEEQGAYLIGARSMDSGEMWAEGGLDYAASLIGAMRPLYHQLSFGELVRRVREVGHEGFMIRDASTQETLMKIKSPHYLTKKFLMRMGDRKIEIMANDPVEFKRTVDEEYYPLVDFITASYRQSWKDMNDQERRVVIEDFLNNGEGRGYVEV